MADGKDGMMRLKIAKKAYVFDTRKKFAATQNFMLRKKTESPAEDIKQNVMSLLQKKKPTEEEGRRAQARAAAAPAPVKSGPFISPLKMAIFVLIALVVAGGLYVMLQLGSIEQQAGAAAKPNVFSGSYDFSVADSRLLSVSQGEKIQRDAYFLVSYRSANLSGMNFSAYLYPTRPASQVFLLDYAHDGADSYPSFRKGLLSGLESSGLPASEIEIDKVPFMPSGALLIVPTGYLPKEFLGMGSRYTFKDLLARGVAIVYIGLPFNDKVLDRDGLTVSVNYSDIAFAKPESSAQLQSEDGFLLSNPRYSAAPAGNAKSEFVSAGTIYGSVSAVRHKDGYFIFLPQSLDGGWRAEGGTEAAADLVRLVREERWLAPIASVSTPADTRQGAHLISLFSQPFSADEAHVKFTVDAIDQQGISRRSERVFRVEKTQKGEMTPVEAQTVPYYLSGGKTALNIQLRESTSRPVKLYVRMYNDGFLNQTSDVERGLTDPTTERFPELQVDAAPGNYTVLIEDDNGRVYAATQLSVIGLEIVQNASDWQNGRFSFLLSANGQAVEPPDLIVTLDGARQKQYFRNTLSYTSDRTRAVVNYDFGEAVKPGNHSFAFTFAGRWTKVLEVDYSRTAPFWENPIVIFLAILSLLVFGIGVALRRPEVLKYGLDIPDFPPLSTIKIPVKKATVLEIFDSVNAAYSWQWMPLRVDELKNGFRKLTYNGKPILIGDFNLERMLSHLKGEGMVKEEIGYWGKTSWEKDSRHTIAYLAIYRIMRNVFVNNAVKFSKLDAMPDCDIKAISGKEEIYLHIMDVGARLGDAQGTGRNAEQVVHRALATSKKGATIIVFRNEEDRDHFRDSLTSTSKLAVGLKMEVNSGNILLLPVKNAITAYLKGIMK